MMDLVRAEFGEEAAQKCAGFHQKNLRSLYSLKPEFSAAADRNAKLAPEFLRAAAKEYWRLPKAPYPPGPDKAPDGVRRTTPEWAKNVAFLKGEGRECYKYDLLARARQQLGAPTGGSTPVSRDKWKFWFGAISIGYAAWYFSKKR